MSNPTLYTLTLEGYEGTMTRSEFDANILPQFNTDGWTFYSDEQSNGELRIYATETLAGESGKAPDSYNWVWFYPGYYYLVVGSAVEPTPADDDDGHKAVENFFKVISGFDYLPVESNTHNVRGEEKTLRELGATVVEIGLGLHIKGARPYNGETLVNATPHPVTIVTPAGNTIEIPPSGIVARLAEDAVIGLAHPKSLLQVARVRFDNDGANLPRIEGVYWIVSGMYADAITRSDLLVPYNMVRDDNGRITGCRGFRFGTGIR